MSENIFSNFYNRVLSFFQKDKQQDGESSKDAATNRLKLVLMQDRSNLDGATMQKMREQLIAVISKYIEIDQEALDLNLEADGEEIALMLNIPVIRARTREEIEEIEAKEQEELNNKTQTCENDSTEENDQEIEEECAEEQENQSENTEESSEKVACEEEDNVSSEENDAVEITDSEKDESETETGDSSESEEEQESKKAKRNKNK